MIKTIADKETVFILKNNYVGYLSYIQYNKPYVVPITYFYDEEQHHIICYSANGHKIDALRKNNIVSMCVTDMVSVNNWKSVLAHGTYKEHSGSDSKALLHQFSLGVKDIILKKELTDLDFISQFSSKVYNYESPIVFTIEIEYITGKKRKY